MAKYADETSVKEIFRLMKANYVKKDIETTYDDLKALRDAGGLILGQQYRITDFVTTTAQFNTQSAEHAFDLIVVADTVNKLNERARAVRHEGDTYFANSKLEAWQVWYSLDNDTSRFAWADMANGKGVIYRMIDEWNNDVPYDFKNIQFKRYDLRGLTLIEGRYYRPEMDTFKTTFQTALNSPAFNILQISRSRILDDDPETIDDYLDGSGYSHEDGTFVVIDDPDFVGDPGLFALLDISNFYWVYSFTAQLVNISTPSVDSSLLDENNIKNNKLAFNKMLYDNIFIGNYCSNTTFGNTCNGNTFDDHCRNNTFGNDCNYNTFGDGCSNTTFGNTCNGNTFGNSCYYNTFGNSCYYNTFGNSCSSNTFGNSCQYNTFGNSCSSNTFGNSCQYNTFGNSCSSNTFGNSCQYNTFGNSCSSNTFGNSCQYTNITGDLVKHISVDNGLSGASYANPLELYDSAIASKAYQISFKQSASGRYLMLWATDTGTMTGKYKAAATDVSWTAL